MTRVALHAIIILPGSERLKGEPGLVRRERPVEGKGESTDLEAGNVQENQAADGNGSGKVKSRVKPNFTGKRRKTAAQDLNKLARD